MTSEDGSIGLDAVTVRYGPYTALEGVTVEFRPGTVSALIGPNGSGKTTLLKALAGLVDVAAGTVRRPLSTRFAWVGQHRDSITWMPLTGREVLRMGRYDRVGALGRFGAEDRRAVQEAAERLEVVELMGRQFTELSGGQRQRILIAQALARGGDVLLMDEPITGLDLASQHRILRVVSEEAAAGRTVVVTTHHLDEASRADQVVLLAGGVVAKGAPPDVLTAGSLRTAYGARVLDLGVATIVDDHGHDQGHDH